MKAPVQIKQPDNWPDFESLCKKLWGEIWNCSDTIKKNGRNGQGQNGVDVYGTPENGIEYYGIQCKGKDSYTKSQLTEKEIDTEIAKAQSFQPPLKRFYFATTAVKDAKIEEYIRLKNVESQTNGGFMISLYSWEDIVDLLHENRDTYNWYINDCQYVDNSDVQVFFNGVGENELDINPQFTLFYKPIVNHNNKYQQTEPNKSIFGMSALDVALAACAKPQIVTPVICSVDNNTYIDLTWSKIEVVIHNTGSTVITDYHIDFKISSSINFELDNDHSCSISGGFLPSIYIKQDNGVYVNDSGFRFRPSRARLVQDESRVFTFYIKTNHEFCDVVIDWCMRSENYRKTGILKLVNKPTFENKETGESMDYNYHIEDTIVEPKKIIKK